MNDQTKINYKNLILYGLILGVLTLAILYLLKIGFVRVFFDTIFAWLTSYPIIGTLFSYVSQNWVGVAAAGATIGIPAVYGVIRSMQLKNELKAKQQLADIAQQQATDLITKQAENEQAALEIAKAKEDASTIQTSATSLKEQLATAQTKNTALQGQVELLNKQLQDEIKARPIIRDTIVT